MKEHGATTLQRGLSILVALGDDEAASGGGIGVVRLAERLGEDKSQVSRSLKTLAGWGLVERDPDGRGFRLGSRLFSLAARAVEPRLLSSAPPLLAELVARLGETAHVSVLRGGEVLTVLSEAPPHAIQAAGWVGQTVPAYASSAGRALLLDRSRAEVEALLADVEFVRLAPDTPASVDVLWTRLCAARELGYAVVGDELEPGLVGIGAPVRDFAGRTVAAVNVSAPRFRFADRLEAAGPLVAEIAGRLSAALGQSETREKVA